MVIYDQDEVTRLVEYVVVVLWVFAVAWFAARIATILVFGSADLRTGPLPAMAGSSTLAWTVGMILTRRRTPVVHAVSDARDLDQMLDGVVDAIDAYRRAR